MEEKEATNQIHQQVQAKEDWPRKEDQVEQDHNRDEKPDNQTKANQENKIIPMLEEKYLPEETTDRRLESAEEIMVDKRQMQAEKVGESQTDSSKKLKQGPKQIAKTKTTVPQPFSLATDKRMARERRASVDLSSVIYKKVLKERPASMDFKELQPKLLKFASFIHKTHASSPNGMEAFNVRRSAANATCFRPKVTSTEHVAKKIENGIKTNDKIQFMGIESRYLHSILKKQQAKELENNKLQKSSTFKALPLPSFYHRKDPPSRLETKKIPITRPKSPSLGRQRKKYTTVAEKDKTEDKGKTDTSKTTTSAKETLNKLIKGTRKALNPSKETVKLVV